VTEHIAGREKIAEYFEVLLEKHGDSHLALEWKSKDSQQVRFAVLLEILYFAEKKENISILDVGSGIGHLYDFLKETNILEDAKINYSGIDISQKLIDFAKSKHPGVPFNTLDLIKDKHDKKYDYVLGSGAFSIKMTPLAEHKETVKKMLSRMFNMGVAVNFLSSSALYLLPSDRDAEEDKFVYLSVEEVLSWVKAICTRYIVRHEYHPGDFTVYMLK
jgi:SAM-dependent methyltransferase